MQVVGVHYYAVDQVNLRVARHDSVQLRADGEVERHVVLFSGGDEVHDASLSVTHNIMNGLSCKSTTIRLAMRGTCTTVRQAAGTE